MPLARTLPLAGLVLALFHTSLATAACAQVDAIVQHAYSGVKHGPRGGYLVGQYSISVPGDKVGQVHDMRCKVWPERPEMTLALVPLMASDSDDGNQGDLDLLLLDSQSLRPLQRIRLHGYMNDDAVRITDLKFDTARYQLAPDKPAFGVRKTLEGSSRPNPFEEVDLSLYTVVDGGLRAVLDGLVVSSGSGEWDTECVGSFTTHDAVLAMRKSQTHGLADIGITGTDETYERRLDDHRECVDDSRVTTPLKALLRFDGSQYVVPQSLAPLE